MDDEFTEFRSGDTVAEIDLLDLNSFSSGSRPVGQSKSASADDSTPSVFSFSEDSLSKKPVSKKRTFIFPYDLDLNTDNLLKIAVSENQSTKPTAWTIIENIEELNVLSRRLVEKGRLAQGLRCKKHAETVGEMTRIKEIKRLAADREDYDTAVQYRNLLNTLEKQLCSAEEIEEWLKDYSDTTLSDLEASVRQTMGEEAALEFKERFALPEITKSSDIEAAQAVMASAQHYITVKNILKEQTSVFIQQTQQVLQKINEELSKALTILYKLKSRFLELAEDNEFQNYVKAIPEVYFIGIKLSKVISLCNSTRAFDKILQEIGMNWEECKDLLSKRSYECKNEKEESVCALCLFSSKNMVMLGSSYFHVPCINFWINRVSTEPPKLNTSMV